MKTKQTFYCGPRNRLMVKSPKVCFYKVLSFQASFLLTFLCWFFCLHFAKQLPNRNQCMMFTVWKNGRCSSPYYLMPINSKFFHGNLDISPFVYTSPEAEVLYWKDCYTLSYKTTSKFNFFFFTVFHVKSFILQFIKLLISWRVCINLLIFVLTDLILCVFLLC